MTKKELRNSKMEWINHLLKQPKPLRICYRKLSTGEWQKLNLLALFEIYAIVRVPKCAPFLYPIEDLELGL